MGREREQKDRKGREDEGEETGRERKRREEGGREVSTRKEECRGEYLKYISRHYSIGNIENHVQTKSNKFLLTAKKKIYKKPS